MPDCGVHYLWFAFVCFLIRSHPPAQEGLAQWVPSGPTCLQCCVRRSTALDICTVRSLLCTCLVLCCFKAALYVVQRSFPRALRLVTVLIACVRRDVLVSVPPSKVVSVARFLVFFSVRTGRLPPNALRPGSRPPWGMSCALASLVRSRPTGIAAPGQPENCSAGGRGVTWTPAEGGGGGLEKWDSVSGPLFCVRTDVGAKGTGTQNLARKIFSTNNPPPPPHI